MSEVVELPTRTAASKAMATLAANDLTDVALARFGDWRPQVAALAEKYRAVAFDVSTPRGLRQASDARAEIREPRYAAQRVSKAAKSELAKVSKAIGAEEDAIVEAVMAIERPIDSLIKAREAEIEEAREAARLAEAERRAKHEAGIATICSYSERCAGLSSQRIAAGIAQLQGIPITDDWEDFKERGELAKAATLSRMLALHDEAKAREDEIARLEAQRIENERIAAEQAAERQRIAEAAAKVKADAEALQKRINEQAEREAAADAETKSIAAEFQAAQLAAQEQARAETMAQIVAAEARFDAQRQALNAEAEALGVRLPNGDDDEDYSITIGLAEPDKPLYAPLRDVAPVVTFAEQEPAGDVFETLAWHDAKQAYPETDMTVLCWGREGFFCGYWDDKAGGWIGCESGGSVSGVTHWAIPNGPL